MIGIGELEDDLYNLKLKDIPVNNIQAQSTTKKRKEDSTNQAHIWYARLGYISQRRMTKLVSEGLFVS